MLETFLAVFTVALVFTFYSFLTAEEDMKRKSERAIFIFLIAIVSWPVSLSLMQAPSFTTTTSTYTVSNVPLNCYNSDSALVATGANTVNCGTTTQVQTLTSTSNNESPFPAWAFYSYMAFSLGMTVIMIVLLVRYMYLYSLNTFQEGLDDLSSASHRKK